MMLVAANLLTQSFLFFFARLSRQAWQNYMQKRGPHSQRFAAGRYDGHQM